MKKNYFIAIAVAALMLLGTVAQAADLTFSGQFRPRMNFDSDASDKTTNTQIFDTRVRESHFPTFCDISTPRGCNAFSAAGFFKKSDTSQKIWQKQEKSDIFASWEKPRKIHLRNFIRIIAM